MKSKTILLTAITLIMMLAGTGCENESVYYEGKVISLNNGDGCNNIIEISKSIPQGLSVNSTITFNPNLYNGQLKIGDTVFFKIIQYQEWTGYVLAMCISPKYVGQIEFYNK